MILLFYNSKRHENSFEDSREKNHSRIYNNGYVPFEWMWWRKFWRGRGKWWMVGVECLP